MLLHLDQVRIKQLLNDLGSLDRIREVLFDDEARDRCGPPATGAGNIYVVVTDPDAVYVRARDLGATLVRDMAEEDYGSRGFSIADAEGNVWSFGTYAG